MSWFLQDTEYWAGPGGQLSPLNPHTHQAEAVQQGVRPCHRGHRVPCELEPSPSPDPGHQATQTCSTRPGRASERPLAAKDRLRTNSILNN